MIMHKIVEVYLCAIEESHLKMANMYAVEKIRKERSKMQNAITLAHAA